MLQLLHLKFICGMMNPLLAQSIISFSLTAAGRLGDKFTVVGSYADNSAIIYAALKVPTKFTNGQ